jgi:hypothetical protein
MVKVEHRRAVVKNNYFETKRLSLVNITQINSVIIILDPYKFNIKIRVSTKLKPISLLTSGKCTSLSSNNNI